MKTLFLILIGTCCASIIPRGFDSKAISSLGFATPNIKKMKSRIGWREWKLSAGRSSSQNDQEHETKNSELDIKNLIFKTDQIGNYLKTEAFSEPKFEEELPQLSNWDETAEDLVGFQTKRHEFETPGNINETQTLKKSSEAISSINPENMLILYSNESDMYPLGEISENASIEVLNSSHSHISGKIEQRLEMESQSKNFTDFRLLHINKSMEFKGNSKERITSVANSDNFEYVDTESEETNTLDNLADSVSICFVTENINSIESSTEKININEGNEMHISMLQDSATSDFQFLIESETLILTEVLDSQALLVTEDIEGSSFIEDYFGHSASGTIENDFMEEFQTTPSFTVNQTISSKEALNSTNRFYNETFSATSSNIYLNGSESKNDVKMHIEDAEQKAVDCPRPGLCIFWFMAKDTCMNSNQCQGTNICCKIGCSKICINI